MDSVDIQTTAPLWNCPLCQQGLAFDAAAKSWSCENRHMFDCAKETYVNLLPSNKKRSAQPGDNPEMIAARRRIHTAEIYRPLAEAVQAEVAALGSVTRILDLGCGEGYYSNALKQTSPGAQVCGVDIAKSAIRLAARQYTEVNFAVASTFQLPVPTNSQDVLVRIFAPSDDDEAIRVLKAGGYYLEVTPAPRHLWALREALYDTPRARESANREIPGMQLLQSSTIAFELELDQSSLRDLVAMTPLAHRGHREKRERLLTRTSQLVEMVFSVQLFQIEITAGQGGQ